MSNSSRVITAPLLESDVTPAGSPTLTTTMLPAENGTAAFTFTTAVSSTAAHPRCSLILRINRRDN